MEIASLIEDRDPFRLSCRRTWSHGISAAVVLVAVAAAGFRLEAQDKPKTRPDPENELIETPVAESAPTKGPLDFHGRVTDRLTGRPLAAASVQIKPSVFREQEGGFKTLQEIPRKTDAEGKFAFTIGPELVANPNLYLVVEAASVGYMKEEGNNGLDVILRNQRRGEKPFFEEMRLRPARPIFGIVLTPEGKPAAGVNVSACSAPENADNPAMEAKFTETRTDAQGHFALDVFAAGKAVVCLLPQDFALSARVLGEGEEGDLGTFTLEKGIVLRGKVLDAKGDSSPGSTWAQTPRQGCGGTTRISRSASPTSAGGPSQRRPTGPSPSGPCHREPTW